MVGLEARIAKLEAVYPGLRLVFCQPDEVAQQALQRYGISDDEGVLLVRWLDAGEPEPDMPEPAPPPPAPVPSPPPPEPKPVEPPRPTHPTPQRPPGAAGWT